MEGDTVFDILNIVSFQVESIESLIETTADSLSNVIEDPVLNADHSIETMYLGRGNYFVSDGEKVRLG